MNTNSEQVLRRLYRALTIGGASCTVAVLALVALDDSTRQEWQSIQDQYALCVDANSGTPFARGVRQISLPRIGTVDRCISCHLAIEDSVCVQPLPPLSSHPGAALAYHSLESFGCTLCHPGDGRDLRVQKVCNRSQAFSDTRESLHFVGSSCFRCHGTLFGPAPQALTRPDIELGRALITSLGCYGCHKIRGVGGALGPALSDQGEKSASHYRFRFVSGSPTIPTWMREHFLEPRRISPGTSMLAYPLGRDSLDALIAVLLGLRSATLPIEYYSSEAIQELKGERSVLTGLQVYRAFCSGCHGDNGQGRTYGADRTGSPNLAGREFQSIASREMIAFIVTVGRGSKSMPAWRSTLSGLQPTEIEAIIDKIRSFRSEAPSLSDVERTRGIADRGKFLYEQYCALCHGNDGEGSIGPALQNQDFLSTATDQFIVETIATGRRNTAMPSWSYLSAQDLADLLRSIRSWQNTPLSSSTRKVLSGDAERGGRVFETVCARCHGRYGEGGIGPAVLNRDFLEAASDSFILSTIERGRQHSPMFGISGGMQVSSSDLLAFMRSMRDRILDFIPPGASLGEPRRGKTLYTELCSRCHGLNGEGVLAPALNTDEFLNAASNGYLLATISLGRSGTPMPAWGRPANDHRMLNASERQDLVAFIRIWQTSTLRKP